jgi:isopenicillin-N epimerase
MAHQQELRLRMEREPVRFFVRELERLWDEARDAIAGFVGCDGDDLVSVPNATFGVNAVLNGLDIGAGDEVLLTNQAYPACRNAVQALCARVGARPVVVALPYPLAEEEVLQAVLAGITSRTRVALIDHVASPTGAILPLEGLNSLLRERGIRVLVDGAHAPGSIPLNLSALGADYYVGNCHKWLCAPKGAGFLHVATQHQNRVHPVVVSLGYRSPRKDRSAFLLEFGWSGTQDPTAFLTAPFAIRYVGALHPQGWAGIRRRNHALLEQALPEVAAAVGLTGWVDGGGYGSMASLPLPDRDGEEPDGWQDRLFSKHGIEVPVVSWPEHPKRLIRLSAHLYNEMADYEALARALRGISKG